MSAGPMVQMCNIGHAAVATRAVPQYRLPLMSTQLESYPPLDLAGLTATVERWWAPQTPERIRPVSLAKTQAL